MNIFDYESRNQINVIWKLPWNANFMRLISGQSDNITSTHTRSQFTLPMNITYRILIIGIIMTWAQNLIILIAPCVFACVCCIAHILWSKQRINWILATFRFYPIHIISFSVYALYWRSHSFDGKKECQRALLCTFAMSEKKAAFFKCRKMPTGYGLNCIDCFAMIWNVHWNKQTERYGMV